MVRKAPIATDREILAETEGFTSEDTAPNTRSRAGKGRAALTRGVTGRIINEAKVRHYDEILNENALKIPDEVENDFKSQGYRLGWVRFKDAKTEADDLKNIYRKCNKLGFIFVTSDEVPELTAGFSSARIKNTEGDIITVGDLALAKISLAEWDNIQEAKARKVLRVSEGILGNKPKGIKSQSQSLVTRGLRREAELLESGLELLKKSATEEALEYGVDSE